MKIKGKLKWFWQQKAISGFRQNQFSNNELRIQTFAAIYKKNIYRKAE